MNQFKLIPEVVSGEAGREESSHYGTQLQHPSMWLATCKKTGNSEPPSDNQQEKKIFIHPEFCTNVPEMKEMRVPQKKANEQPIWNIPCTF